MKTWLAMWNLLLRSPLIVILLGLVYLTAALLFVTIEPDKRGAAVAAMSAFAAGGLAAVMTERIARYSLAAGSLGIPDHARVMRRTQALFLTLFVAAPGVSACLLGQPPLPAAAVLLTATAAGITLSMYGLWWLMLVPAFGRFTSLWHWLTLPVTQATAVVASAWLIWHWFELPQRRERISETAPLRLGDSRHERTAPSSRRTAHGESVRELTDSKPIDEAIPLPSPNIDWNRGIPLALAMGLGYSLRTDWRQVLYGAVAGLTALLVWRALRGSSADGMSYLAVSAVCYVTLVARLQSILNRWMRTSAEQAILRIAPFWPADWPVKRAILQSTFQVQRGAIAAWSILSTAAWSLHFVGGTWVFSAAIALAGTSLAFSASMWATLARRQIREWHLSTILIVITVGCGTLIAAFGSTLAAHHLALGIGIMLIPPTAAVIWYILAPLRVPVSVDARALQPSM